MYFNSPREPITIAAFNACATTSEAANCIDVTLSNGLSLLVSVVRLYGVQYASFGLGDKRFGSDNIEPIDVWKLPQHLGPLKAVDVVAIAPEEVITGLVTGMNRLCLATHRPWVNIQEITALFVGETN